jgi:hypothetical protein
VTGRRFGSQPAGPPGTLRQSAALSGSIRRLGARSPPGSVTDGDMAMEVVNRCTPAAGLTGPKGYAANPIRHTRPPRLGGLCPIRARAGHLEVRFGRSELYRETASGAVAPAWQTRSAPGRAMWHGLSATRPAVSGTQPARSTNGQCHDGPAANASTLRPYATRRLQAGRATTPPYNNGKGAVTAARYLIGWDCPPGSGLPGCDPGGCSK